MNGAWSSSSSRFFACMDPSWVRRAWTGSTGALPARPRTMSRMPAAARPATRIAMTGIRLDLDVHDLADEQEAEEHHETAEHQDDHAGRKAEDRRWIQEHRCHEARRDDEQDACEADRQARDHVTRQSLLRGERPDLALDADPFPDRVRDRVEDLGEVAADLVLDADGGGHELEVVRADAADHVLERLVEG